MGQRQEWPFEGRIRPLRADVLVSLATVSPCFGVRQDGCDALLIALVFFGAVEAGALMESIMVRAAASRRHLLQRLGSRSCLVDFLGKIIALSRSVVPNCTWRARSSRGFLC
jgi:hypothetical protein